MAMMALAVGACDKAPPAPHSDRADMKAEQTARFPPAPDRRTHRDPHPAAPLLGERIARVEWRKATRKAGCAPLALVSDGGAGGIARRADFSGGWGVAFDQPGLRSAYGFAGPGTLPMDAGPAARQRDRLKRQWPHMMDVATLPHPSFAGYGLSGAAPYPSDNPEGYGLQSVAYLRVGGQTCTYNVWSRISRAHLESLLGNLRLLR